MLRPLERVPFILAVLLGSISAAVGKPPSEDPIAWRAPAVRPRVRSLLPKPVYLNRRREVLSRMDRRQFEDPVEPAVGLRTTWIDHRDQGKKLGLQAGDVFTSVDGKSCYGGMYQFGQLRKNIDQDLCCFRRGTGRFRR